MIPYLDVCSGYSAFTQGSYDLGFDCAGYAEIDTFPCALLGHHYGASAPRYMPDPAATVEIADREARERAIKSIRALDASHFGNRVINFGDFSQIKDNDVGPVQLLTGGTPCQAFSMAGKRLGLDDPRGNLTLEFLALAKRVRAEWLLWENVAGFLSHDGGRTAGTFFGLLGQLGYGWAYRLLDAQFIRVDGHEGAVPQRRRRVFVVAHLGDAAGPAAVLFDRESLRGNPAPRRRSGQSVAGSVAPSLVSSGRGVERTGETRGQDPVVACYGIARDALDRSGEGSGGTAGERSGLGIVEGLAPSLKAKGPGAVAFGGGNTSGPIDVATTTTTQRLDFDSDTFIAQPIAATLTKGADSAGRGGYAGRRQEDDTNLVAHALTANGFDASEDGTGRGTPLVPEVFAIQERAGADNPNSGPQGKGYQADIAYTLEARNKVQSVAHEWAVRRLTPRECERLMGCSDDFTLIPFRGKLAADGPRYKALGNSQAINNMRWIARGIADVIRIQGEA